MKMKQGIGNDFDGNPACSDDDYPSGEQGDCTSWTSYIDGVNMTAGNTYYIVIDGYGYSREIIF